MQYTTIAGFTIWTQAAALSCVEGVSYDYHATYFRNKLVAGAADLTRLLVRQQRRDRVLEIDSILAFERCVKRASRVFAILLTRLIVRCHMIITDRPSIPHGVKTDWCARIQK